MFVDQVEIITRAGKGGDGCMSFRREKFIPRGGPDGGDGGDGGSVIFTAVAGVDSLSQLIHQKHWNAENGQPGSGAKRHGKNGSDLIIKIPPGTLIYDTAGDLILKDMTEDGMQVVVSQGGRGGKGNTRFKSSVNRSPRQYTKGGDGQKRRLRLELQVIADVGLIGKPNAGKSTLLSRLSRARPEIAAYPFTTKYPNLGRVQLDYDRTFIIADIPGLIEGASEGVGLGHEFLRHIKRAGILVHLVEPMPMDDTDPVSNYRAIRKELELYDTEIAERPEIVVITKAELPDAQAAKELLSEDIGQDILMISSVTGEGLNHLVNHIDSTIKEHRMLQ